MRNVAMFMLGAAVLVGAVGCPGVIGPPASAILAGDWTGTDANGVVVTVTFNADGIVVSITSEDGASAEVTNSTTELDGDAVTITIGGRTFEGTLSEDQNTITGTIEQEITAGGGDVVITIPAGDFEINRVPADPCDGVTCEDGESCVDGDCVADDPCDGVTCEDGETCVDGDCVAADPCEGNACDDEDACNGVETCDPDTGLCVDGDPVVCEVEGETCVDGVCGPSDPCEGTTCTDCETCVDGECVPLVGDDVAGGIYYSSPDDGNCFGCHAPDGSGGFGPSLIGADCQTIFNRLTGVEPHEAGGTRDITGQDAADLEAWLAM